MSNYLAFDLGAESGRAMLGILNGGKLHLEELHRFSNEPVRVATGLYWDTFRLFHEMREGLRIAGRDRKLKLDGIAVDTWGVDFGLVGADGSLVDNPRHYRDPRTNGIMERLFEAMPRDAVFAETGVQFMQLNSLYQLYAMKLAGNSGLQAASRLLFMPDLFNFWLTGEQKNELTIASTSQFYNPAQRRWATEIFDVLGLDQRLLGDVVPPGVRLGELRDEARDSSGLAPTPVFTTASHDTASAVAAVPAATRGDWCYISSGTWSLMGVELESPIVNPQALALNLTNEVGVEGKVRLLKNIAGLWLLQECRKDWAQSGREMSYELLARMAGDATPFLAVIDPDAFLEPGHMTERIKDFCSRTGQRTPVQPAQFVRIILESLALRYRQVLEGLERLLARRLETIHVVGGGSKNQVLNQFVADATGLSVVAGPGEATAAGNILVQAMGAGQLKGLGAVREVVRNSFPLRRFEPESAVGWDRAYDRFQELTAK